MVESFVVLNRLGGECLDDLTHLREDKGRKEMLGHATPSPEAARQFLYQFHAEEKIEEAKQQREAEQIAFIPGENDALAGVAGGNRGGGRGVREGVAGGTHAPGGSGWSDI